MLCRNVNRRLAQLYDAFTYRTVKYYRTLDYEQKASGGEVRIIFDDKEQPISGECTFREDFPPMMRRITNFSAYIALVHAQSPDEFLWKIVDPLIQENNGLYKVTLGRSESRAVKLEEDKIRSGEEESIQQINIADVPQYLGQEDPLHRCCVSEVV